ncbi:MAG: protein kinase, partial [Nannocystaceae bacterium]|nr:protein kinase [Nannocystaceae bacterium]
MPESRWEPGAVVDGYKIIRRLARGGMAELFLAATTNEPTTQVAIKRVHAHLRSDPGFDAMFVRETRIAASLDHPNIVRVLGTGTLGDELYLVMELLRGLDARALLRRLSQRDTPMSYGDAIRVVIGAAHGLAYAHDREDADGKRLGIVHRDVSPSNLFVTESGEVKLVDFGIAKTTNATQITGVGVRKGKGAYMAPEQCMAGVVDRRTDVFALGAVLYELTTMTRAYDGDNELAVLHAITSRDVEPPSARVHGYPEALEAVVLTALQRDPDQRSSDATEMADALSELGLRPRFASSPASLASLVQGLSRDRTDSETPLGPSTLDLTPPPFGVGDRSDGALLLPTPTSMEEIVREDTEQVTATAGERDPDYTQPPARGLPHPSRRESAATAVNSATPATPATPAMVIVPSSGLTPTPSPPFAQVSADTASAGDGIGIPAHVVPAAMTQVPVSSPATAQPQPRAPNLVFPAPSSAIPVPVPVTVTPSPAPLAGDSVDANEPRRSSLPMGWIAAGIVVVLGGGLALWAGQDSN